MFSCTTMTTCWMFELVAGPAAPLLELPQPPARLAASSETADEKKRGRLTSDKFCIPFRYANSHVLSSFRHRKSPNRSTWSQPMAPAVRGDRKAPPPG